jgi:small GTP-binding protein
MAGKTRFSILYTQQIYSASYIYEETIEDTYVKQTQMDLRQYYEEQGIQDEQHCRDIIVKFDVIDTSGNEENINMGETKWAEMDGFMLLYDVSNRESFNKVQQFYNRVLESKGLNGSKQQFIQIPLILVANKIDLPENEHQVSTEEGAKLARSLGCKFIRTSCKDNIGVDACFNAVVNEIINVKYMKPDENILAALFGVGMSGNNDGAETNKMENRKSIKELKDIVNKRLSKKYS